MVLKMKRIVIFCLFFLIACEAVFEDDLSNKSVVLVSPSNDVKIDKDSINFKWNSVENADTYTLQIVTPSFDKAEQVLLDTTLSKTFFLKKNIQQGNYQWRLKAQNSEYETNFSVGSFNVYIENLSNRKVSLVAPINNIELDKDDVTFSWNSLKDAENYTLQVVRPSFENAKSTILDTTVTGTSFVKKITKGNYQWRVRAKNTNYETNYTTGEFKIFTENLSDRKVSLLAPVNNVKLDSEKVNFNWSEVKEAESYILQIASPSFEVVKKIILDTIVMRTSFTKKITKGSYQWRVRAKNTNHETNYTTGEFKVFTENLSDREVNLLAPINNVQLNSEKINFNWDEVKEAESYILQVATPSFKAVKQVVLDVSVTNTFHSVDLPRGDYQWRVKAKKSNYETEYTMGSFKVYTENLSDRKVSLLAPINNVQLDSKKVNFNWNEVKEAESYTLQVATPSFKAIKQVVLDISVMNTFHSLDLPRGDYQWRVKAKSNNYQTEYVVGDFSVFVENLSDREVNLIAPTNMVELDSGGVKFDWDEVNESENYVLQIAAPSFDKAARIVLDTVLNKTTLTKNLVKGKYEWRVKAINTEYETKFKTKAFTVK